MLPIVRKEKIKELIRERKSISVVELSETFKLTEETIRKDLSQLEKEGFLKRTYGGAYISDGVQNEIDVQFREHIHIEGKRKIALACSEYINNGDSIFLDASTTSLYIAQSIHDKHLTITTNSLKIATALADENNINLVLIGGNLHLPSMSLLGKQAENNMNHYFFDKAFISCRFLNIQHEITDSNEQQAEIRHTAVQRANTTYLVADYTKFDRTAFKKICSYDEIDFLITDNQLPEEWTDFLSEKEIIYKECL
ncbi:DeoR/GlpR transcriptional regulator [Vagococcus sp. BWB3-3]|uniref:DeoR/GlpR transcriptional regulator n=1 Tax=Vagococcus allomyrinae TaxID=2794353 RepID=A0A940PB99_9ENTE|nr:DeoR/GlpR family DNA-binding transcription regulator [Vagococcus allomyrinae]MBP1039533.1 DeoR/GlpR transcriptional regulator [Vagococcus allomyrinae]